MAVAEAVGDALGEVVGVALAEGDAVGEAVIVCDAVGEIVGDAVVAIVGDGESVTEGVAVNVSVGVGDVVAVNDGDADGEVVAVALGDGVGVAAQGSTPVMTANVSSASMFASESSDAGDWETNPSPSFVAKLPSDAYVLVPPIKSFRMAPSMNAPLRALA